MDAFSYLSVLLSIVFGLALTQVLSGYRSILLNRERVRLYAPAVIWSAVLLLVIAQSWWASFGLSDHVGWTFAKFITVMLHAIAIYMGCALVLPDIANDAETDLKTHYYRQRVPFFMLLLLLMTLLSIMKDVVLDQRLPEPANLAFHAVFAATTIIALISRREWLHRIIAPLVAVILTIYIAALFADL